MLGNLALMKAKNPYGVIVCDEAHRLKNTETKVWKELSPNPKELNLNPNPNPYPVTIEVAALG